MIWFFLPSLFVIILFLVILLSYYVLEKRNKNYIDLPKSFMFLVKLMEWTGILLNKAMAVSITISTVALLSLIGFLVMPSSLPGLYVVLVIDSILFSYVIPKIIPKVLYYQIKWTMNNFSLEYKESLARKYKMYLGQSNCRILTYFVLLCLYSLKNCMKFSGIKDDLTILEVSAEALLTFVIFDTIATIYKEKKSEKS
ncbi:hypothetical protein FT637_24780 [Bacillus cereus]|nr:hypothetical protein [Bacillus cereus]